MVGGLEVLWIGREYTRCWGDTRCFGWWGYVLHRGSYDPELSSFRQMGKENGLRCCYFLVVFLS